MTEKKIIFAFLMPMVVFLIGLYFLLDDIHNKRTFFQQVDPNCTHRCRVAYFHPIIFLVSGIVVYFMLRNIKRRKI